MYCIVSPSFVVSVAFSAWGIQYITSFLDTTDSLLVSMKMSALDSTRLVLGWRLENVFILRILEFLCLLENGAVVDSLS